MKKLKNTRNTKKQNNFHCNSPSFYLYSFIFNAIAYIATITMKNGFICYKMQATHSVVFADMFRLSQNHPRSPLPFSVVAHF